MKHHGSSGFSLMELLITIAVIGILASIAYPSYTQHVQRSNRTEGQALLNEAAARQERYYAQNNKYGSTAASLGLSSDTSSNGHYKLTIEVDGNAYALHAAPQGVQAKDSCGSLSLDEKGVKSSDSGNSDCWK